MLLLPACRHRHDLGGAQMRFVDRVDAGRQLAERLRRYADEDVVVLGLPAAVCRWRSRWRPRSARRST